MNAGGRGRLAGKRALVTRLAPDGGSRSVVEVFVAEMSIEDDLGGRLAA